MAEVVLLERIGAQFPLRPPANLAPGEQFPGIPFANLMSGGRTLIVKSVPSAEIAYGPRSVTVRDQAGRAVHSLSASLDPEWRGPSAAERQAGQHHQRLISLVPWTTRANYCHFVLQGMSALHVFKSLDLFREGAALLVNAVFADKADEAARLLGIDARIVVVGDRGVIRADEYVCLEGLLHPAHWGHTDLIATFPRLKAALGLPDQALGGRLFIKRPKGNRGFVNEADVLSLMRELDVKPVELDGMSLADQARLFSAAELVVAGHGAGLSNLVFCPPGSRVIEIHSRDYSIPTFWVMAQAMGLRYAALMDGRGPREYVEARKFNDILAPIETLRELICADPEDPRFLLASGSAGG